MAANTEITSPGREAQHTFIAQLEASGFKFGLVVYDAFVRGIRDLGYKSNGWALSELIDNAIQAGAERVDITFGYEGTKSEKKPAQVAVIDSGHGMEPSMIRLAVMWGGTHREDDRSGMGRYGYGLPCSAVSVGRRFTVYSKPEGGQVHAVTIDLDEISTGSYTDETGEIIVPSAVPVKVPAFVEEQLRASYPDGWRSGTAVVIEKLDRLQWKTGGTLRENLLRHLGVIYHKLRDRVELHVDGVFVEPIDPLFLTPDFRFYDLDADRAVAIEPLITEIKDPKTREAQGTVRVRYCYMPPTFASIDKRRGPDGSRGAVGKNANPRLQVMKEYNGIIFSRMGRLIDVASRPPWTVFQNNDRYIGIEVEFDAVLDEEFGITTSKQQVSVSDRMWDILAEHGVPRAIDQLRRKVKDLKAGLKTAQDAAGPGKKRASEEAMEGVRPFVRPPSAETQARQDRRGRDRLRMEAEKRAFQSGKKPEEEEEALKAELKGHLYKVDYENMPGAPFFRVEQFGGTKVVRINTAHRFYHDVYAGPDSSARVRAALEVLLFAIGDCIEDASEAARQMYIQEVPQWSLRLEAALEQLSHNVGLSDDGDEEEDRAMPADEVAA